MMACLFHALEAHLRVRVDYDRHVRLEEMGVHLLEYIHGSAEASENQGGKYVPVTDHCLVSLQRRLDFRVKVMRPVRGEEHLERERVCFPFSAKARFYDAAQQPVGRLLCQYGLLVLAQEMVAEQRGLRGDSGAVKAFKNV